MFAYDGHFKSPLRHIVVLRIELGSRRQKQLFIARLRHAIWLGVTFLQQAKQHIDEIGINLATVSISEFLQQSQGATTLG